MFNQSLNYSNSIRRKLSLRHLAFGAFLVVVVGGGGRVVVVVSISALHPKWIANVSIYDTELGALEQDNIV